MATKNVKPAPGRKVRRPEHAYKPLPAEGMPVHWSPYWERLLQAGDIVIVEDATEQDSEQAPAAGSEAAVPKAQKGGKS